VLERSNEGTVCEVAPLSASQCRLEQIIGSQRPPAGVAGGPHLQAELTVRVGHFQFSPNPVPPEAFRQDVLRRVTGANGKTRNISRMGSGMH
jgi:hypothetical protein